MKAMKFILGLVPLAACALLMACSNDDVAATQPATEGTEIPFTVVVNNGSANTRASVDADLQTLKFATGDKLYISGTNISGVLDIQSGVGAASATFSGSLTYTGGGTPASSLALTATLVSAQQTDGAEVTIAADKTVTVNYGTALCTSVDEAVKKYSLLTGSSTYGARSFTLSQGTAFLNFAITLIDGTTAGTDITATVANVGGSSRTGSITAITEDGKVKVKFVAPVATQTLSGATFKINDNPVASFGGSATLAAKVYHINRTLLTSSVTNYEAQDGDILTGTGGLATHITIADNATVKLNGVDLTTIGNSESYKWAGLTGLGDCTLILEGSNYVRGGDSSCPGIHNAPGKTLTIRGNGSLTASSNGYGVGIGGNGYTSGSSEWACGNIVIEGGTIIANGGWEKAGIGGKCGNITITGGNVTATGGTHAAGIGTSASGTCGNILISGGTVNANGSGYYDVGIGAAGDDNVHGTCGTITITNDVTKVTAKGSVSIGANGGGVCGTITVGGEVMTSFTNPYTYEP